MRSSSLGYSPARSSERGQILLMLIVLLAIVGAGIFYTFVHVSTLSIDRDKRTFAAMAQAKAALIGWAASNPNHPGSLPCPDVTNDGLEDWTGTACSSYIGRLPWQTLAIDKYQDASQEVLWYALSPNFRNNAAVEPLNSDSLGQLTITGVTPATNVIAIIFAPGAVLSAQDRKSANQNDVTQYLEGENANGDMTYATATASPGFNDQLLPITTDALFAVVAPRVAKEALNALEAYRTANGYYPNELTDFLCQVC